MFKITSRPIRVQAADAESIPPNDATHTMPWQLTAALLGGILALAGFSFAQEGLKTFVVLFMLSGAAFLVGSLVGFLFGIPKSRTDGPRHSDDTTNNGDQRHKPADGTSRAKYWDNANLEEVSDWLTKIIVGLGLVQFGSISSYFHSIGATAQPSLKAEGALVLQGSLLYFLVLGFIVFYLWTRIVFYGILIDVNGALQIAKQELGKELDKFGAETLILSAAQAALAESGNQPQREFMARQLRELADKGQLGDQGHVVLGRIYRSLSRLHEAIDILSNYIDKHEGEAAPHKGVHTCFYNRSCYYALSYGKNGDGAMANHALSDLQQAMRHSSSPASDADFVRGDADFASLRDDPALAQRLEAILSAFSK